MGIRLSFPLTNRPILFDEQRQFTCCGRRRTVFEPVEFHMITELMLRHVIEARQAIMLARKKFYDVTYLSIADQFPDWDERHFEDLRAQFLTFDKNLDGLVDIEELCEVLDDLGDMTPYETRLRYFRQVDIDGSNTIDFEEFLLLVEAVSRKDDNKVGLSVITNEMDGRSHDYKTVPLDLQIEYGLF